MEKQIKTIGVLTSGGDAPGMNAAVRAVVRAGLHKGFRMIGIQRGYNCLLDGECFEMNLRSVSNIISAGGTILYTARCLEFKTKEGQDKGAAKCRELGIDALVVIGGDGSYRGARELAHRGIPMIGLPGTIDNDISCTDYTIGYDTAMNTALEMIDKLRDTTQSHDAVIKAQEMDPELAVDGELQFDAAVAPEVAQVKCKGSKVAGQANTFIFPCIEAGNIGYKIAQRLGGYAAYGPILQGLNAPINDLSRGCNADEVYKMSLITACQS